MQKNDTDETVTARLEPEGSSPTRDELVFLIGYLRGSLSTIKSALEAGNINKAIMSIDSAVEKCKPIIEQIYKSAS